MAFGEEERNDEVGAVENDLHGLVLEIQVERMDTTRMYL